MKGEKGKTHLKIAYYLPYRTLLDEIASDIDTLYVESGYMILDKDWNISAVKLDTLPLLRSKKKTYSQIKFLFIDVDPDSSEINLFFNPLNSNISCFYKTRTKIENYSKCYKSFGNYYEDVDFCWVSYLVQVREYKKDKI